MVVSCAEEGEGRIWGCFHLALGLTEGESWSPEIQREMMVTADRSCEVHWKYRKVQIGFGAVIEGKEAQREVCNKDGYRLKGNQENCMLVSQRIKAGQNGREKKMRADLQRKVVRALRCSLALRGEKWPCLGRGVWRGATVIWWEYAGQIRNDA